MNPISAASSVLSVSSVAAAGSAGPGVQPPAASAEQALPVRQADSASFSPEALAMLEAEQATEGG